MSRTRNENPVTGLFRPWHGCGSLWFISAAKPDYLAAIMTLEFVSKKTCGPSAADLRYELAHRTKGSAFVESQHRAN